MTPDPTPPAGELACAVCGTEVRDNTTPDQLRDMLYGAGIKIACLSADRDGERKAKELLSKGLESVTELYDGQKHEIRALKADVERLNQMVRATGYGQGQIDAYVAQCEEIERLEENVKYLKDEIERIKTAQALGEYGN